MDPTHEVPRINPKSKEICTQIKKNYEPKQIYFLKEGAACMQANGEETNLFYNSNTLEVTREDQIKEKKLLWETLHTGCQGETQGS